MARLSATEAARNFSELLNRVAAGEEVEIVRNGATVAVVTPPKRRVLSAEAFRELIASAPRVDDRFVADLREIRSEPRLPEEPWPS